MDARTLAALAVGVLTLPFITVAQVQSPQQGAALPGPPRAQLPTRDGAAVATGTARIRGRVVAADNGNPLRRATIRISAAELRVNRSVNTDAEGRYEFTELPAGRYSVFVSRNGYVSLQFGQRRPFETGRPLDVSSAQIVEKIDFALPRGGVIAGRVTDELGEPISGVRMQAMRYQYLPNGARQLVPTGGMFGFVSNDLGEFRMYGLMPGTYVVSGTASEMGGMVMPGGPAVSSENDGHGVTYYPGTLNEEEAQPITVGIADEASASFALIPARMTRISGIVRDSQGRPLTSVMLTVRSQSGGPGMSMRSLAGINPDGTFSLGNIPPGEHWLEVLPRGSGEESASVAVTAGGQDITGLVITTHPGATISGQVVFDGAPAPGKSLRIMPSAPDPFGPQPSRIFDGTQGVVDENGTFQLRGMFGRAIFNVTPMSPGTGLPNWSVKSVMLNGQNITDVPTDVSALSDSARLEIVVTDKRTTVSGVVRGARGETVSDYTVVIFPQSLKEGMLAARYTRVARPDQQGRFEVRGLPPGDYVAAAVDSIEQGGQWDPSFRKQIEPNGRRFRLTEAQTATVDLTLTP